MKLNKETDDMEKEAQLLKRSAGLPLCLLQSFSGQGVGGCREGPAARASFKSGMSESEGEPMGKQLGAVGN